MFVVNMPPTHEYQVRGGMKGGKKMAVGLLQVKARTFCHKGRETLNGDHSLGVKGHQIQPSCPHNVTSCNSGVIDAV